MGPQDVDEAWLRSARHLHATGVFPTVSFDTNLRRSLWATPELMRHWINHLAAQADWVPPGLAPGPAPAPCRCWATPKACRGAPNCRRRACESAAQAGPPAQLAPLRRHAKVTCLPHTGSATHETLAVAELATTNLPAALAGEQLQPALPFGRCFPG